MMLHAILQTILVYSAKVFVYYFLLTINGAAIVAVYQESKIWNSTKCIPSLSVIGCLKVYMFNLCWMIGCFVGTIFVLLKYVITFGTGKSDIALDSNRIVENYVAKICVAMFIGNVTVIGTEHLPPLNTSPAPVYIANHASQIDLGVVYYLNRRFKWISKQSVLYVPGVGTTMYLSKHVFINRAKGKNSKSVSNLFEQSNKAIQNGIPMFFFPQGTRRIVERIPAKDGAFIVAQQNRSLLIPISIDIPTNAWNSYYPLTSKKSSTPNVIITIHPSIPSTTGTVPTDTNTTTSTTVTEQKEKEERAIIKNQCMEQIYSVLPTYDDKLTADNVSASKNK
jgi:lysophosphatidate acyltransferase